MSDPVGGCPFCGSSMTAQGGKVVCPEGHYKANAEKWDEAWNDFRGRIGISTDTFTSEVATRINQLLPKLMETLSALNEVKGVKPEDFAPLKN